MLLMLKQKILIIDDEKDFCLLLSSYLAKNNYEVFISNSLADGMQSLEDVGPNIVFLDNNLPDGLGWEKIEYILDHYKGIKLNLISAYYFNKAFLARFPSVKLWEKPFNVNELNKYLAVG
jgi:DNA-binding NtrC family response regulator